MKTELILWAMEEDADAPEGQPELLLCPHTVCSWHGL